MSKEQARRTTTASTQAAAPAAATAAGGNQTRTEDVTAKGREQQAKMLEFIETRLAHASSVQQREIVQTFPRPEREWGHLVADSHKQDRGLTRPEPTEWNRVAAAYHEAATAIARGDLARGGALLRQAFDEDRKAYARLTNLVGVSESERPHQNPWHSKVTGAPTASVHMPAAIDTLAEAITAHYDAVKDPPVRAEQHKAAVIEPTEDAADKGEEAKKTAAPAQAKPEEKAEAPKEEVAPAERAEAAKELAAPAPEKEDRLAAAARRAASARRAVAGSATGTAAVERGAHPEIEAPRAPAEDGGVEKVTKDFEDEQARAKPALAQAEAEVSAPTKTTPPATKKPQ